jgi:hypothetical protein
VLFNPTKWVLILTWLCFSCFSVAHEGTTHGSAEGGRLADALHWIELQQTEVGEFTSENEIAAGFQATTEAIAAFDLFEYTGHDRALAVAYLNTLQPPLNTELLARLVGVLTTSAQNTEKTINELLVRQNDDGGFGHQDGFDSTPLDTAYALNALTAAKYRNANVIGRTISYLVAEQADDGGYSVGYESPSSVMATSLVAIALKHYLFSYNIAPTLNSAMEYLYAQQNTNEAWNSSWETSLALLALIPATTDTSRYAGAVAVLQTSQSADGDWGDSPYTTSMAISAIRLLASVTVPADPTKGSVAGKLVSDNTGTAINDASIEVVNNSTFTVEIADNGAFVINSLEPGTHQITYSAPGYLSAAQSISLKQGQVVSVGTVKLAVAPTTAVVSGQISEASSRAAIAGAQISISVAGDVYLSSSDSDGNYQQTIPEGSAVISVASSAHHTVTVQADLLAGTHTQFSPSLFAIADGQPVSSSLIGKVINGETGVGIEGVSIITSGGGATTTDVLGGFEITDVDAGTLSLQLSKSGYSELALSVVVPEKAIGNIGQVELREVLEQETTTVSGRVVDLSSGDPVQGASVAVGPHATQTDSNGFYRIQGINLLEFEVAFNATGYVFGSKFITLSDHTSVTADIMLRRAEIGGVSVSEVMTDKEVYTSYEPVLIAATIRNETAIEQRVRLYVKITDDKGEVISTFSAVELPVLDNQASPEELSHFEEHLAESVEMLAPGQERSIELERWWNVGRVSPGGYQVTVQVIDAATSQLMSELSSEATVATTEDIASLHLTASPEFVLFGVSADVDLAAKIFNRSNVPVATELQYRLKSPSGEVLTEGRASLNLETSTVNETVALGSVAHSFIESGRYLVEVEVLSGVSPRIIKVGEVFVPPSTRLEVRQSLAPYEAVPVEGVQVNINIEVKGVDSEQ